MVRSVNDFMACESRICYAKENENIVKYWCPVVLIMNIVVLGICAYYLVYFKKMNPAYDAVKSLLYIVITLIKMIVIVSIEKSVKLGNDKRFNLLLSMYIFTGSVLACLNFASTGMYTYYVGQLITILPLLFSIKKHIIDLTWLIISFFIFAEICIKDYAFIVRADITMSILGLTWGLLGGILIRNYHYLKLIEAKTELDRINKTDALTGIGNRLSYEMMREQVNNEGKPVAILYADINNLKYVNDNYGHVAGDELIRTISGVLQSALSEVFYLYRTGGDEFVCISKKEGDYEAIELMLDNLKNVKTKDGLDCNIAIGYASSDEFPENNISGLEKIAEQRMYKHKTQYYLENGIERRGKERRKNTGK